jgi:hypothetical protein
MIEIDDFLQFPDRLISYSKACEFKDEINPIDGVVYPHICKDIPKPILNDVIFNLTHKVLGRAPVNPFCFMRMSPAEVTAPHKFHTDNSMGAYSMMIYLQDAPEYGTGFAQHIETDMVSSYADPADVEKGAVDVNNESAWNIYRIFSMKKNKAIIFDSHLFHVALPIGGFGSTQDDSRIVFTCFFS